MEKEIQVMMALLPMIQTKEEKIELLEEIFKMINDSNDIVIIFSLFFKSMMSEQRKEWFPLISSKIELNQKIGLIAELEELKDKIELFEYFFDKKDKMKLFLFNEKNSNFDKSFENMEINEYQLCGLSDYTKTWVLESKTDNFEDRIISARKVINFDLNILQFLNKFAYGKHKKIDEFKAFLEYIKNNNFEFNISTAIMERSKKTFQNIDQEIWMEIVTNYLKFIKIECSISSISSTELTKEEYYRASDIFECIVDESENNYTQYDAICCLVIKAFLIKMNKKIKNKTDTLLEYSLSSLNVYLENEIILLDKYFNNDISVDKSFKKIEGFSNNTIDRLLNTVWDIFHVRLLEVQMRHDNLFSDEIHLHYFSSHDKAFRELLNINPLKLFFIQNGVGYAVREIGIQDICSNKELLEEIKFGSKKRKNNCKNIDYHAIKQQLIQEIQDQSVAINKR